ETLQTIIFKTVTEVPPPVTALAPEVPTVLSDALSKALAKRPADRYESMADFAAALAQVEQPARGGGAIVRRRPDLATRVRETRQAMPRVVPWATSAAVALAVWGFLF